MKLDQFPQGVTGLLAPVDEFLIRWKVVVNGSCPLAIDHIDAELLQAITELDIFHPVEEKIFIEATGLQEKRSWGRNISSVVVRKIKRPGSDRVRIVNAPMAKVSQKWI